MSVEIKNMSVEDYQEFLNTHMVTGMSFGGFYKPITLGEKIVRLLRKPFRRPIAWVVINLIRIFDVDPFDD
jgi:hypothetical protein